MRSFVKLLVLLSTYPLSALAGPSLPSGGGGAFDFATKWLQQFVDFMSGPWATAVVIVSLLVAAGLYAIAPKEGALGLITRIAIAGVVILNVGAVIAGFKG